jgi:hypothetical protein
MCKMASPVNVREEVTHLRRKRHFAPGLRGRVERVEGGPRADAGNTRCA